jgi:hypothetical protein
MMMCSIYIDRLNAPTAAAAAATLGTAFDISDGKSITDTSVSFVNNVRITVVISGTCFIGDLIAVQRD